MARFAELPLAIEYGPAQPPSAAVPTNGADGLRSDGCLMPPDAADAEFAPMRSAAGARGNECYGPRRDGGAPGNALETRAIQRDRPPKYGRYTWLLDFERAVSTRVEGVIGGSHRQRRSSARLDAETYSGI
jgi:hypothetical protein